MYTILKINNGSYKYKNVDTIDNVMLTYSWIKSIDVPLFICQHHIIYSIHILYLYLPWFIFKTAYINWKYKFYISLH